MKRIILIASSLLLIISLGILYYFSKGAEEPVAVNVSRPSFLCRGKIFSEKLSFQNKLKVVDIGLNDQEVESLINYQLMFGLSNFQYMPLETPLQNISLRSRPQIQILNQDISSYGKNLEGEVLLPSILGIAKKWPKKISENDRALEILYQVDLDVDYCVKSSLTSVDELPLYFPLDPVYAYYSLERDHWNYITSISGEKSVVLNRCQNYHRLFETDIKFSEHYWSQWNPTKRGKEAHTDFYECKNWLREGSDYVVIYPERTSLYQLHFNQEKRHLEEKQSIVLRFFNSLESPERKSFYEVAIAEILNGKNFLYTLPNLSVDDQKLFKWLGELSSYIKSVSKVELVEKEERLRFGFKGLVGEKETQFELVIGKTFNRVEGCGIGITYSFDFIEEPLSTSSGCQEEFYYIPQSLLTHTLFSQKKLEGRAYFLNGWPSLADDSSGAYLLDFISRREKKDNYGISDYLESENREDAFVTLPRFEVIPEEK